MDFSTPPKPVVDALQGASEEKLVAVMEVMHFIAKADGFLSADELRHFLKFAKTVSRGTISSSQLSELVKEWGQREIDNRTRLAELAAILGDDATRRAAYDLAAKMATADGELHQAEMGVLDLIEEVLNIS